MTGILQITLGHTIHFLGHGFKSGLPIGPFLSEMLICFYGMGMEYSLGRHFVRMAVVGWIER